EAEVSEKIRQTVDSLNANFQAGLIAGTENAHGLTIHVLEGSLDGDYARLAPEERAGYALADGWLLVASHATTLRTLAARQPTAPGETPEASPASRIGGGWLDLTRGGKTLRAALAAFSLKMSMSGDLDDETRLWIRQARDWIQSLEPLGRVDVELEQEGPTVRLHLTARPCEKETL
ncbi:MAG: hypothetical protein U1E27_02985, partial [Kiritimatiellia bacterium]|nr:hypothetical protein [Kiritimatiellia bacterium]